VAKAIINVINNLQKSVVFIKDRELHSTEHCQGFAKGEGARSLVALVPLHNTKNVSKKRRGGGVISLQHCHIILNSTMS